ncbi:MAG: pyruvate kinase, partial [Actinobacteria bacterium]|nr:pyruvate kinase [Actinomycetota bacterium]
MFAANTWKRRAKIVCTMGPAVASQEKITQLIESGMNVARLNLSHGDYAEHERLFEIIRASALKAGRPVAILVDLQGPKIRLGRFSSGPHRLSVGDKFTITIDEIDGDSSRASTTYKGLPGDCKKGDLILIDDGSVMARVVESKEREVITEILQGGTVSNNKGINLPGVAVSVPAMSEKDVEDLKWALKAGADFIALSFVRSAKDIEDVHRIMDSAGVRIPVIAKIEKPQAVENLQEIIDTFDGLMVARGDLGVELPFEDVPMVQKRCITAARENAKPVIVATQMLDSMIHNPRPTRAEATDCANAVIDGADALMLSGETSI